MRRTALFITLALCWHTATTAETAIVGQTYQIAEPDALEEIQERVRHTDWEKELNKDRASWSAFKGVPLPVSNADHDITRKLVPFYTTEFNVTDGKDRVLYPKGYTFNPLSYISLSQRILVLSPGQEAWAKQNAQNNDIIIYTHGDVVKQSKKLGKHAFILDQKIKDRLDLRYSPSIITQRGSVLDILEVSSKTLNQFSDSQALLDLQFLSKRMISNAVDFVISPANATCKSSFINPITDISWRCIFPMRIAGVQVVGGEEDPSSIKSPICTCKSRSGVPILGLKTSFWEPKRIIDTVSDAYCMMPLGTQLSKPTPGTLNGGDYSHDTARRVFQQSHYYIFPAWKILEMFYDIPCLEDEGFDVAMMTEILPQWNNDVLSLLINPEAILFANPITIVACSADAVATTFGMPLNAMFWCMGSWGNVYPLSGSITATDVVEANAGIAARTIFFMGRMGLLWNSSEDGCYTQLAPIWRKNRYKLQMMRPAKDSACIPLGREGLIWTGGKHDPLKDNFMWMMFEKKDCCIRAF
ncbi:TraU family protein [Pectobacterium versatile]|uniref:TraU family protein n=1 Tax=Pectobacterium versatile TaxID=2488639 RepID=UPI001F2A2363|nr:TraU family protein [Pectobacterium versatile]